MMLFRIVLISLFLILASCEFNYVEQKNVSMKFRFRKYESGRFVTVIYRDSNRIDTMIVEVNMSYVIRDFSAKDFLSDLKYHFAVCGVDDSFLTADNYTLVEISVTSYRCEMLFHLVCPVDDFYYVKIVAVR